MLGYSDMLSRPSIDMNTICEPIIKKTRWKKNVIWAKVKKFYIIEVSSISCVDRDVSPNNSLCVVQQDTWHSGYRL